MESEFLKQVADRYTVSMEDALKGWVILLNGRIYITDSHIIFHETKQDAARRFYNDMRWKFYREVRTHYGRSLDTSSLWRQFKKENNFEIKQV
jgi:hypothetical protein